jgi:hypothetical protein
MSSLHEGMNERSISEFNWCRSSFCMSGECVEVSAVDGAIFIRDSKEPHAKPLRFSTEEFSAFVRGAAAGDFASFMNS